MKAEVWKLIDPELRNIAAQLQSLMEQFSPMTAQKLECWRYLTDGNERSAESGVSVVEQEIDVAGEEPAVSVYVVNSKPGHHRPGILLLHGGGFYSGSARASIRNAQHLAKSLDCIVVIVDYRLAPETRYEGSLEDNYAALCWMHDFADDIGLDRNQICIVGESAGGGHAVLLSAATRDRGGPPVLFQTLSYPMLDDRTGITQPVPDHIGVIGWNVEANRFGWQSFLGREPGSAEVPKEAVPARIRDLTGLPPTFIGVGGLDLFVGENIEFARRLVLAGVPTELLVVPGAFHGFDSVAEEAEISRRFNSARLGALSRAFGLGS